MIKSKRRPRIRGTSYLQFPLSIIANEESRPMCNCIMSYYLCHKKSTTKKS
jgi:hypothetical protein